MSGRTARCVASLRRILVRRTNSKPLAVDWRIVFWFHREELLHSRRRFCLHRTNLSGGFWRGRIRTRRYPRPLCPNYSSLLGSIRHATSANGKRVHQSLLHAWRPQASTGGSSGTRGGHIPFATSTRREFADVG